MLIVEESGNWGRLIKSLYGQRFQVQVVSPSDFKWPGCDEFELLLVQYCEPCLDTWISLFDKTGFRIENLGTALLNAPTSKTKRSWCQELGFHEFVNDMESLSRLIKKRKNELSVPAGFGSLSVEMMQRIPRFIENEF